MCDFIISRQRQKQQQHQSHLENTQSIVDELFQHEFNCDRVEISLEKLWDLIALAAVEFKPIAEQIFLFYYPMDENYLFYKINGMYTYAETIHFIDYYDKLNCLLAAGVLSMYLRKKFIKIYLDTYMLLKNIELDKKK